VLRKIVPVEPVETFVKEPELLDLTKPAPKAVSVIPEKVGEAVLPID
jgi:hypothetical protein